MSYSNILVACCGYTGKSATAGKSGIYRQASKGTHQFNYSRFRPGNVQSISCADA